MASTQPAREVVVAGLELARALQRRGGRIDPGAELPVPETLEGLIVERLATLTPEANEVCRVVAESV